VRLDSLFVAIELFCQRAYRPGKVVGFEPWMNATPVWRPRPSVIACAASSRAFSSVCRGFIPGWGRKLVMSYLKAEHQPLKTLQHVVGAIRGPIAAVRSLTRSSRRALNCCAI